MLLRLEPGEIDLQRLALLNIVYGRVLAREIAPHDACAEIERIASLRHAARPLPTISGYGAMAVGVSVILGGHNPEIPPPRSSA